MIQDLISHMAKMGYSVTPDQIPLDGKIHRFDHGGKKNGWCIGYQNHTKRGDVYVVALFGDWKTGEKNEYQTVRQYSGDEKKQIKADIAAAQKKAEEDRARRQEEVSVEAAAVWASGTQSMNSDYLKRKGIMELCGTTTGMGSSGREVWVPMRDVDGKLWGIQSIAADGKKMFMSGQKKSGTFHVVPFVEKLDETDVIYIAEGFATAYSVHKATGLPCVVAFDCHTMMSVAKALKSRYSDKAFIICGDDDRFTPDKPDGTPHNPGREAGDATAKAVLGKAIYPKFTKDNGQLTDFNDLHLSEGLEVVKNQILGIKPEFHALTPLGVLDGTFHYISSTNPTVTRLSPSSFTKTFLMTLMPLSYWENLYPNKVGVAWDLAVNDLIQKCLARGTFNSKMIRGAGVWLDDGRVVVNYGSGLWVDGDLLQYRELKTRYVYESSLQGMIPREDQATADQMTALHNALKMLKWKNEQSAMLLLGWLMVAPLAGCMPWRPHIWITGGSGSGKSFVMNKIVTPALGSNAYEALGSTTEAGIRQELKSGARPVVFDELETDDDKSSERVKSVVELCRQASSETGGSVTKGSAHGKAVSYAVRFSAVVASIRPNLQHAQDRNRFAQLDLLVNEDDTFKGENGIEMTFERLLTPDFCARLFSRSVRQVRVIQENLTQFSRVLGRRHNGRFADQYGTMLAGYFAAVQDEPVSRDMADWVIETMVRLDDEASEVTARDEHELLDHVYDCLVRTDARVGDRKVGELIERASDPRPGPADADGRVPTATDANLLLQRYGLRVIPEEKTLAVKPTDREFRRLLQGTKWKSNPGKSLERLKGAEKCNIKMNGRSARCIKIPL